MKKIIAILAIGAVVGFTGCANAELKLSKCLTYKDGKCISKTSKEVYICKSPTQIGKVTYCEK